MKTGLPEVAMALGCTYANIWKQEPVPRKGAGRRELRELNPHFLTGVTSTNLRQEEKADHLGGGGLQTQAGDIPDGPAGVEGAPNVLAAHKPQGLGLG